MNTLAILSPNLGARSETFIRRHMQDLLPGQTIVIARSDAPPYNGHWDVDCPKLIIQKIPPSTIKLKQQIVRAAISKIGLGRYLLPAPSTPQVIKSFLTEHKTKVILAEYLDYSIEYLPIAKELGIKVFAHAHGYDISSKLKDDFWRKEYLKLNDAAGIITMSIYSKQRLMDLGLIAEKIHIIPYGIQVPNILPTKKNNNPVRFLSVGRMVNKKAPIFLLDSFRRALSVNPNIYLDYVGEGPLFSAAQQFVYTFNLSDKIRLHGAVNNEKVLELMQTADVFLQHSVTCPETGDQEGLPVAILEAMAYYLPVISTFHAGIPEAVIVNTTGLLVNEGDTTGMAHHIATLAENPTLRQKMGILGRKTIEDKFTWEIEKESLLKTMAL